MNFIKKVLHVGPSDKKDVLSPCVPPTTITNSAGETISLTPSSNCSYLSKSRSPSSIEQIKDFTSANYFNFYRNLERNHSHNVGQIGLVPNKYVSNGKFLLKEFSITSEMSDSSVVSVWTQTYENTCPQPVEANYKIPLSPTSAVSDFTVTLKDKVLKGKVKENEKAKEKYSDSIASGGQAFLAEKTTDGFFKLQVGNLPPGEKVTIAITIISEIGTHLESLHYCLHRFIFPSNEFKFNYSLNASLSTPIERIELDHFTPTIVYHDESKTKASISFSSETGINKNIIAIIVPKYSDKPESFVEYSNVDKSYAVALNFYPSFSCGADEVDQKSEYVFLIDCSGSMSGLPIKRAKVALEICMRSLNENSKFNIVCFGSSFVKLFTESKGYNDLTLAEASRYIAQIDANLGGTELLPPIKDILSSEYDPEYPRQVFIFTDGEVDSRDALIDYVGKEANTTRIFTYGIGSGVDVELVIGLSKACKGYYELIKDGCDMEEQVMKLISIAMQPTLSNIKVDWASLSVQQSPSQIRPLFNQERMMIYGILDKEPKEKQVTIHLIGNGPLSVPISFPITLNFDNTTSSTTNQIHTLSAFKRIQDLEEAERKHKKDHKQEIVDLGKKYGLVSKHTSYIVTADSDKVTEETMKTVDVLKKEESPINYNTNTNNNNNNNITLNTNTTFSLPPPPQIQCIAPSPARYRSSSPPTAKLSSIQVDCDYLSESLCCDDEEELDLVQNICAPTMSSTSCPPPPPPSISQYQQQSQPCPPPPPSQGCPPPPSYGNTACMPPTMLFQAQKQCAPQQSYSKSVSSSYQSSPISNYPSTPTNSGNVVIDIIRLQKANGSFSSVPESFIKSNTPPSELKGLPDVWTTLLVIAKFMAAYNSKKSQWELVAQKATKFIKQQLLKSNITTKFEDLLELAKKAL